MTGRDDPYDAAEDARASYALAIAEKRKELLARKAGSRTPEPKIATLRARMSRGDWIGALRIAARFPELGCHKIAITQAWGAYTRPGFYQQLGKSPVALIDAGFAALKERYGRGA